MNAADRKLLRDFVAVVAEYIVPPRPSGIYDHDRWEKEQQAFQELQRTRAIRLSSDMEWISKEGAVEGLYIPQSITAALTIVKKKIASEIAEPLPYRVTPGVEEPAER
jgi:hypothetical protein